jgi:hypothetical protein
MRLQAILQKHARSRVLFDQEPVKDRLLEDLKQHKKLNNSLYIVYFSAVCVVCAAAVAGLLSDLFSGTRAREAILAGAGVALPVALQLLRSTVREWSQTNLLITLVGYSDETQVQALIEKLLSSNVLGTSRPAGAGT